MNTLVRVSEEEPVLRDRIRRSRRRFGAIMWWCRELGSKLHTTFETVKNR